MPTLWVIDDDDEMNHAIKLMLELLEFSVETYLDPRRAVQALQAGGRPQAIILDINMPEVSGIDMLEFLRRQEAYRSIPVVMLSTETTDVQVDEAMAMGADAFVFKPVTIEELEAAIERAVKRRAA